MSSKPQAPAVNVNEVSRISTGTVIKGEINSPNDIRIDGTFEGKIVCKGRVVAGEKAVIKGDIVCENVDFWGKLEGCLYVKDTLTLKDTCTVTGDLHIKRLVVELGARFNGACKMLVEGEFEKLTGTAPKKEPVAVAPAK
ncbi:MAG: polymer-forming cytoskeletal protein [Bacteroidales bacterium]|nr:polymer-forming cytoskeletal protein [Bacteroidales bacterium]MDY5781066.1 polymer-forming cytoskeletal protein [Candidatus Cryptobacteroides sp.]